MNDIEAKAMELVRAAFEVIERGGDPRLLFANLCLLERRSPDMFVLVAAQMETDNGRWADAAKFPIVKVHKDATNRIEAISFLASDRVGEADTLKYEWRKSTFSDETAEDAARDRSHLIWRSDYGELDWFEEFANKWKSHPT